MLIFSTNESTRAKCDSTIQPKADGRAVSVEWRAATHQLCYPMSVPWCDPLRGFYESGEMKDAVWFHCADECAYCCLRNWLDSLTGERRGNDSMSKMEKKTKKQETKERRREHSSALMSSRRRQGEKQKQRQKELGKWEDVGSLASHIQFDRSNHTGRGVIQVSESMRRLCHAVFTPLFSWSCIPL